MSLKIELHIDIINRIADYVETSKDLYDRSVWIKENFMVYKRFYVERLRIEEALAGGKSCFDLC